VAHDASPAPAAAPLLPLLQLRTCQPQTSLTVAFAQSSGAKKVLHGAAATMSPPGDRHNTPWLLLCALQLERFQQTEDRLQHILASQVRQSEAGMRLSSKDWAAFRKRLTRQWALKYHRIGR
jgi:hypothetical protein